MSHATMDPKVRAVSGTYGARGLRGDGPAVASALKVSRSRLSHLKKNDAAKGPVAKASAFVLSVADDDAARAAVSEVQASYLRRPLLKAADAVLLSRLSYLWDREHNEDGLEDRECALFMAGAASRSYLDALRDHAETQREIAELIDELEWRGVDARAVLLQGTKGARR